MPAELPYTTRQQFLTLHWALIREPGRVRAVGRADASVSRWDASLTLEGLDVAGRVVSRGSAPVRPGFGTGPTPFQVELVPTGGENGFRLRVRRAEQFVQPSR